MPENPIVLDFSSSSEDELIRNIVLSPHKKKRASGSTHSNKSSSKNTSPASIPVKHSSHTLTNGEGKSSSSTKLHAPYVAISRKKSSPHTENKDNASARSSSTPSLADSAPSLDKRTCLRSSKKRPLDSNNNSDKDTSAEPFKRSRSSSHSQLVTRTKVANFTRPGIKKASRCIDSFSLSKTASPLRIKVGEFPTVPRLSERRERQLFLETLNTIRGPVDQQLPPITLYNDIDNTTPPTDFRFIDECLMDEDVILAPNDFMSGCECEATRSVKHVCKTGKCACLDNITSNREGPYPYYSDHPKIKPGCLQDFYLESPYAIFECNARCKCGPECKNRNVQFGRQLPLEIFKTPNRGWGLRCPIPIVKGQFIDTYRGEIVTSKEADRRAETSGNLKESYLYAMDKFIDELPNDEESYVVDGQHMGGVTRFMNHCCTPNCGQFTVLYNHADIRVYDLAFFALEDIPAYTELTFDYIGRDLTEEEKGGKHRTECLCGAEDCRGFLWL